LFFEETLDNECIMRIDTLRKQVVVQIESLNWLLLFDGFSHDRRVKAGFIHTLGSKLYCI